MNPDALLDVFTAAARAVRDDVTALDADARRARTTRAGQYALDVAADAAACAPLRALGLRVVSEESGVSGDPAAAVTVVVDPVDGSTNAARGLPGWATSLCALDEAGPVVALVADQATGELWTAVRGGGAYRDGRAVRAAPTVRVEEAVVALSGLPARLLGWRQFRVLGSCALALAHVAGGGLDGYLDPGVVHAPWDYLGGLLLCREAGAVVHDLANRPLEVADPAARRQLVAAGTPELARALAGAA